MYFEYFLLDRREEMYCMVCLHVLVVRKLYFVIPAFSWKLAKAFMYGAAEELLDHLP